MSDNDWLASRFEENRQHLRDVAYRMLGSAIEADDAVQECWLRLSRSDTSSVDNLGGWLTTVVARICLDMLRSREARREDSLHADAAASSVLRDERTNPEHQALLADSVGVALLVVLDTLPPAERIAFVLHDLFDLSFDEIAPIVERSPAAARQLASRARRRVKGASAPRNADHARRRQVVDAFLAASREGDFQALLAVLDPDIVVRADGAAAAIGAAAEVRGAQAVAGFFAGRARAARPALVGGAAGLAWAQGGEVRVAFGFTITNDKITEIELISDPTRLKQLDVVFLER